MYHGGYGDRQQQGGASAVEDTEMGPHGATVTATPPIPFHCYSIATPFKVGFLFREGDADERDDFAGILAGTNSLGGVWDNAAKGAKTNPREGVTGFWDGFTGKGRGSRQQAVGALNLAIWAGVA